jgi:hypothetical protein
MIYNNLSIFFILSILIFHGAAFSFLVVEYFYISVYRQTCQSLIPIVYINGRHHIYTTVTPAIVIMCCCRENGPAFHANEAHGLGPWRPMQTQRCLCPAVNGCCPM